MWKLVVFFGCLFLGACQNTYNGGYVPRFSEYVGLKERVLFEDFGNPDFYYEVDGVRYLVYGTVVQDAASGNPYVSNCQSIFRIEGGIVVQSYYNSRKCFLDSSHAGFEF